ncbi:MAG: hypothetical protein K5755_05105 [Clostridiales bacterium]|nr:hypothetical protein [Clostridia bacterium]MCR4563992.1 hypothetical protein [Clostridiales bacterium]
MKESKFTKREKIIAIVSGVLIIGLACVVVFQYFTIINTQRKLSKYSDSVSSVSDEGKIVWVNPDTTVVVPENNLADASEETSSQISEIREYVINKNSKKIHSPECESAKQTLDKNKETVTWTDEEYLNALDEGYSPCSICKAGR